MKRSAAISSNSVVLACAVLGIAAIPKAGLAEDFSLVVLPDSQRYGHVQSARTRVWECGQEQPCREPGRFAEQTLWLVDHANDLNLKRVIHVGDVVNNSDEWEEWDDSMYGFSHLNYAGIHFTIAPGNHDMDIELYPNTLTKTQEMRRWNGFRARFINEVQDGMPLVENCTECMENNYATFVGNGTPYLIVNLEYLPPKDIVCRANQLMANYKVNNSPPKIIVVTHAYQHTRYKAIPGTNPVQYAYNTSYDEHITSSDTETLFGLTGEELWDELIRRNSNIFMVLSGHAFGADYVMKGTVHQILTDFQRESDANLNNEVTGAGWLRLLTFSPTTSSISSEIISTADYGSMAAYGYQSLNGKGDNGAPLYPYQLESGQFGYKLPPTSVSTSLITPSTNVQNNDFRRFGERLVSSRTYEQTPSRKTGQPYGGPQLSPSVATSSFGTIVVWDDDEDGNEFSQIRMRGFASNGCQWTGASGAAMFTEQTVNQVAAGQQKNPKVAMNQAGDFVVVWEDDRGTGNWDIMAAGFDRYGNRLFNDVQVNGQTPGAQKNPSVAINESSIFVVVWDDDQSPGDGFEINGRAFDRNGSPLTGTFDVNQDSPGDQRQPTVGLDSYGRFVTAWVDAGRIYKRGLKLVANGGYHIETWGHQPQVRVTSLQAVDAQSPSLSMKNTGSHVVAWSQANDPSVGTSSVYFKGFLSTGVLWFDSTAVGGGGKTQSHPAVSVWRDSNHLVVAWEQSDPDDNVDVNAVHYHDNHLLKRYDPVNRSTANAQEMPAVAMFEDKSVVVWTDHLNRAFFGPDILMRGFDDNMDN